MVEEVVRWFGGGGGGVGWVLVAIGVNKKWLTLEGDARGVFMGRNMKKKSGKPLREEGGVEEKKDTKVNNGGRGKPRYELTPEMREKFREGQRKGVEARKAADARVAAFLAQKKARDEAAAKADRLTTHYGYNVEDFQAGVPWPPPRLALELRAYKDKRTEEEGGLGAMAHFRNAWKLMWPQFEWTAWVELMVYAWCKYDTIAVIGHGAAGKTYVFAHIALLDYLAEPMQTITSLTTVTADGLKLRMWSDLNKAYESSSVYGMRPLRVFSTSNRMNMFFNVPGDGRAHEKYLIEGMSTSKNKDAEGRIRGKHAPRKRVILDEAEDMPDPIYNTFSNIRTDPDAKIVMLTNPREKISRCGLQCEPKGGWGQVTPEDLFWETAVGGCCVHLDGLQNPNMKAGLDKNGQKKYSYMLGPREVEAIRISEGEDSAKWWEQVRGFPAPDGVVSKVWPSVVIDKARADIVFDFKPEAVASLDPAFEHDDCVLMIGDMGKLRDGRTAVNMTKTYKLVAKEGAGLPTKDLQLAEQVMELCKAHGVKPEYFIMDKTGGGRGVYAQLHDKWSMDVIGINYYGAATERPLRPSETEAACELVDRFVGELWFRARYFAEAGLLGGIQNLDSKTVTDLSTRLYFNKKVTAGSVMVVETKDEMKKRLGRSPDYGDTLSQIGELMIRHGAGQLAKEKSQGVSDRWRRKRELAIAASKLYSENRVFRDTW